jgi:hypothetical protein
MVEGDIFCPFYPVVLLPFVTRAVGAGLCEAVEHRKKKGSFEGELELAVGKKIIENFPYAELIPQAAEDEGYADLCILRGRCLPVLIGIQKGEPFREPGAGAKEAIDSAADRSGRWSRRPPASPFLPLSGCGQSGDTRGVPTFWF